MAVTDLTNTKWVFNETLNWIEDFTDLDVTYNINIKCHIQLPASSGNRLVTYADLIQIKDYPYGDGIEFAVRDIDEASYNTTIYSRSWYGDVQFDKIITIVGGNDVTNPDLIAFLQANATQMEYEATDDFDLSNTLWKLNQALIISKKDEVTEYDIHFINYKTNEKIVKIKFVNSDANMCMHYIDKYDNEDVAYGHINTNGTSSYGWNKPYESGTIKITGGIDVINPELISFLQTNATQIEHEETDDLTGVQLKLLDIVNVGYGSWNINFESNNNRFTKFEVYHPQAKNETGYLTFSGNNAFTMTIHSKASYDGILEYSTDTTSWIEVTKGTAISSVNNKIYIRGSNNTYCQGGYYWGSYNNIYYGVFTFSNYVTCDGNIETLLDYQTVLNGEHPTMAGSCFEQIFRDCIKLMTAPRLPATTLTRNCYFQMFWGCISLTTAPALPATTLADGCYQAMFHNCTSLTTIPALPAAVLPISCYSSMFDGCSLIKISDTQSDEYPYEYRMPYGLEIGKISDSDYGYLTYMFSNTGGTLSTNFVPKINKVYYTSNEIIQ